MVKSISVIPTFATISNVVLSPGESKAIFHVILFPFTVPPSASSMLSNGLNSSVTTTFVAFPFPIFST